MDAGATLQHPRPDALLIGRGSARLQPADYPRGMQAYRFKITSSPARDFCKYPNPRRTLGRALTTRVARPFPSAPRAHVDDFRHLMLRVVNSVTRNSEIGMGRFEWNSRNL